MFSRRPQPFWPLPIGLGLILFALTLAKAPAVAPAIAAAPPAGDFYIHFEPLVSGLEQAVGLAHAGDGRLFMLERAGRVLIINAAGDLLPTPFLDITGRVQAGDSWEQGLLGLAFHPDYAQNGVFFANYTGLDGHTRIARFQVSADPDRADAASEVVLMVIDQPTPIHNGGTLAFGPDGYLYIGTGDGGGLGDPHNQAQSTNTPLGKLLRIDVAVNGPAPAYSIPAGNPFAGIPGAVEEIWAIGLRNPWGFTFDRLTGHLYLPDVGNFQAEEVNFMPTGSPGGMNFGWRCFEGELVFNFSACSPNGLYTFPMHSYQHQDGRCAIIGGQVYRGSLAPSMDGHYFFADLCTSDLWSLHGEGNEWHSRWRGKAPAGISAFGAGSDGEMYATTILGEVYHQQGVTADMIYLPVAVYVSPQPTKTPTHSPEYGPRISRINTNWLASYWRLFGGNTR